MLRRKTILIVEDEPTVRGILAEILGLDGYKVEVAKNGQVALEKLREHSYDVIVTDIRMPGGDGQGLYRAIERWDSQLLARVIFMTGYALGRDTQEFLARTRNPCLQKPFAMKEVHRLMRQIVQAGKGP
jgi:CheY-like chemotaxis protein